MMYQDQGSLPAVPALSTSYQPIDARGTQDFFINAKRRNDLALNQLSNKPPLYVQQRMQRGLLSESVDQASYPRHSV